VFIPVITDKNTKKKWERTRKDEKN
jgi:hypothetical protein